MAEVALQIGGYSYTVHCGDGEEGHLRALASRIDAKVATVKQNAPGLTEVRQLLFAAILMADEVHDLSQRSARQGSLDLPPPSPQPVAADEPGAEILVSRLNALADRIDTLAARLAEAGADT